MNRTCFACRLVRIAVSIALDLQRGAGSLLERDAQFVGDDVRQGGFSQPGRTVDQHVVHSLGARAGRFDGDGQIFFDLVLPNELREFLGAQLQFKRRIVLDRRG